MKNKNIVLTILFVFAVVFAFSWFAKDRVEETERLVPQVNKVLPEPAPNASKKLWKAWCEQNPDNCKG